MLKLNFALDLKTLPTAPGVYFWKNQEAKIIYVGKAKNIQKRIQEYLDGAQNSYKTSTMLTKAYGLDFIVCANEKEALLLEQELIKNHQPQYNILLLDDKKYPFIVVQLSKNKLEIKLRFYYKEQKNSFYYGPLPTGYGAKVLKDFLIRECLFANGLPITSTDVQFWTKQFQHAKAILSSSNQQVLQRLKRQMHEAAAQEQFEIAREIRDTINYLSQDLNQKQAINFKKSEHFDVVAFWIYQDYLLIIVHHFLNGVFSLQEEFVIEIKTDFINEICAQFLNQFYKIRNVVKTIITNIQFNNEQFWFKSHLINPQKGAFFQALTNALENAKLNPEIKVLQLQNKLTKLSHAKEFLEQLCHKPITDFLMIDNSNIQNTNVVSVLIYYKNFQPFYSHYRKYHLPTLNDRKADVEYIKQGLSKYFAQEKQTAQPDLILVDGGIAQVLEAQKVLKNLALTIPVLGLVKNEAHQTDHIIDGQLQKHAISDPHTYTFLAKVQQEVDQFAKNFYRKTSLQNSLEGFLQTISGIGPKLEIKLLQHFKTYANIFNASEAELCQIVPQKIAQKIIAHLKNSV